MKVLKVIAGILKRYWIFILGFASLVWFLIRVIPKPGRAAYPCQRAAFPLASAFVVWLTGTVLTFKTIQSARYFLRNNRIPMALAMIGTGIILFTFSYVIFPAGNIHALGRSAVIDVPELSRDYNVGVDQFIDPHASVAIVQSAADDVLSITKDQVESMVREAVALAGGLEDLISDGNTVVLKPNIVRSDFMGNEISPEANGMVTDWRVVAAVAKMVREINPSGLILVMEGSADQSTSIGFGRLNYTVKYMPEVDEFLAIEEVSGDWQDYGSEELASVLIPGERALYADYKLPNGAAPYYYNRRYYEADVIISIPVLKNHQTAGVTGAVKNLGIGGTPTNIYGNASDQNGRWNVINHKVSELQKFIHDYYYGCPAHFAVMDGIQGYSNGPAYNFGPSFIEGHQEQMGIILASDDPVALDAIESLIMFDDPGLIPYLVYLDNSDVGCADPRAIEVRGILVSDVKKVFPHESEQIDCDYTDQNPPGASIERLEFENGLLTLSMANSSEINRLDLAIDGQVYPRFIISQFDDIQIDLSGFVLTDTMLTIFSHDQYMNTDIYHYKGNTEIITGITDFTHDATIKVYPNPVRDLLRIRFNSHYAGDVNLSLYNQAGQLKMIEYKDKPEDEFSGDMDLSGIESGSYILVVTTGDQRYSVSVIKE